MASRSFNHLDSNYDNCHYQLWAKQSTHTILCCGSYCITSPTTSHYRLWKLRYLIDAANTSQKTQIKPSNTATHTPTIECLKSKYDSKYPWTVIPAGYPAAVNGVVISPNWDTTKPYKVHATGLR